MSRLLIIEDDHEYCDMLDCRLGAEFELKFADDFHAASRWLMTQPFDGVLLDIGLPDAPRETVVKSIKAACPDGCALLILSGYSDLDFMLKSIRDNACDYLIKGKDDQDSQAMVSRIRTDLIAHSAIEIAKQVTKMVGEGR